MQQCLCGSHGSRGIPVSKREVFMLQNPPCGLRKEMWGVLGQFAPPEGLCIRNRVVRSPQQSGETSAAAGKFRCYVVGERAAWQ